MQKITPPRLTTIIFRATNEEEKIIEAEMLATRIYRDEWEVGSRLVPFGVTSEDLTQVALLTASARADSVPDDPRSAPGLLSYIYGTRFLRQLFTPLGWYADNHENISAVLEPSSGVRIIYQNVDLACDPYRGPRAVSGKGSAASRLVDTGQGQLFNLGDTPEVIPLSAVHSLNSQVWYFCVSFADDEVRAELSLPAAIDGENFSGFLERIFIVDGRGQPLKVGEGGEPPINFEPIIVRK